MSFVQAAALADVPDGGVLAVEIDARRFGGERQPEAREQLTPVARGRAQHQRARAG